MIPGAWSPELHPSSDDAAAADFVGPDMERRNCELSDSFAFCEREEVIAAKYGYGGDSEAAQARRAARVAVQILQHRANRLTRIERESGQARRWAEATAAELRRAGDVAAAERIESNAKFFEAARANDQRA